MEEEQLSADTNDKDREQFIKWARKYAEQNNIDVYDVESDYDPSLSIGENYSNFAKNHPNVRKEKEMEEEQMTEDLYREKHPVVSKTTQQKEPRKASGWQSEQVTEIIDEETQDRRFEELEKENSIGSRITGITNYIGDKTKQYLKGSEIREKKNIQERKSKAEEEIDRARKRLELKELESKRKQLKEIEFRESTTGKVLSTLKGFGRGNDSPSPMKSAISTGQNVPWYIKAQGSSAGSPWFSKTSEGEPWWAKSQRPSRIDSGYQRTGYRQPRRKVITINGRTYVVQGEPQQYNQPVEQPSMIQSMLMTGNRGIDYTRKQPERLSPLMEATFKGTGKRELSPFAQAVFSHSKRKERSSQLGNALISSVKPSESKSPLSSAMFGKKKSRFKFF